MFSANLAIGVCVGGQQDPCVGIVKGATQFFEVAVLVKDM